MNLDELLAPIRADSPAGDDLSMMDGDLTMETLRDQRRDSAPEEDPAGEGRVADWRAVAQGCEEVLRKRSKDLEAAVLLADAWARVRGFPGVRDGLDLVRGLCEGFWPGLHPGAEDGEVDLPIRARWLNWLASPKGFLRGVSAAPLVELEDGVTLRWEGYELAQHVDERATHADKGRYQELIASGLVGSEDWRAQLLGCGVPALTRLQEDLGESQAALSALALTLDRLFGEDESRPSLSPLADQLDEIRDYVSALLPDSAPGTGRDRASAADAEREEASVGAAENALQGVHPGRLESREDALRVLAEVGAYFRRNEPHSPIAALVARAVRWGAMPFEQVLQEVVRDQGALARAWETLGIEPDGDQSG